MQPPGYQRGDGSPQAVGVLGLGAGGGSKISEVASAGEWYLFASLGAKKRLTRREQKGFGGLPTSVA